MSYLEKRLGLSNVIETVKDGSEEYLGGKFPSYMKFYQANIAKYRHSFLLWKSYVTVGLFNISDNAFARCKNGCLYDSKRLHGGLTPVNSDLNVACMRDCSTTYIGIVRDHVKVLF